MRRNILVTILTSSVIAAIAGCGKDSANTPPDAPPPDAEPDAPPLPVTRLNLETDGLPALVAVREGTGPWTTLPLASVQEIEVRGPYTVTVVCDEPGDITTWQVSRTPDDERDLFLPCGFGNTAPFFEVTGTMVQPGAVALDFSTDRSTTPDWDFTLDVAQGAHDLVAFDANRIEIRRNIEITAATAITPTVDIVAQGTALVASPFVAPNITATETARASINLLLPQRFTFTRLFSGNPADAKVVPPSLLVIGDRQSVRVSATEGTNTRTRQRGRFQAGDPAEFVLPPHLGAVTFTTPSSLAVAWTTLPPHDFLDSVATANTEDFKTFFFHDFEISGLYIEATSATGTTFDTDIPGYKPEWRIDFTKEYQRSLTAVKFGATETDSSTTFEEVNVPIDPQRLRARNQRVADERLEVVRAKRAGR